MKEIVFAKRVKDSRFVSDGENLLIKQELQIGLTEEKCAKCLEGGYVILDFGKEMNGGIRILVHKGKRVKVRIRFGESLSECCSELYGEQNATNDHALRDFYAELQNYSDMSFANTGFRFVRLDFYGDITIKTVVAQNNILRKRCLYSYTGDDKLIKRIYLTAKRTVDLCAAGDYLWDGVKRDRLVWIGDIHPEMLALTTLYGRLSVIERSLDYVREKTPLPAWMNRIPMYSMWWIIILADYYEKTKSKDYLDKQIDYLEALVEMMAPCVKEDGSLDYPSYFVDWPSSGTEDELGGVRAINIIAMKKAMFLLEMYKRSTVKAKTTLDRLLLKKIEVKKSKQVAGLKHWAVGLDDCDRELLVRGGAEGMSTFMSYYILTAVASFDKKAAVEMMKEYYGSMLDKGATTFWEDYDILWAQDSSRIDRLPQKGQKDVHGDFGAFCYKGFRHSLCHGWSAGVLQFIKEECQ
ncbi:MAG: alpha-L-rhamnosidase [Ruminococcaceae bacterium]|nr:alpha-L-rhamnosidase [Oscillospiraceae bacterium]